MLETLPTDPRTPSCGQSGSVLMRIRLSALREEQHITDAHDLFGQLSITNIIQIHPMHFA